MDAVKLIGVAYPVRDIDVAAFREALPRRHLPLLRPGSVIKRCAKCNIPIVVGPRLNACGCTVICALCAHREGMRF